MLNKLMAFALTASAAVVCSGLINTAQALPVAQIGNIYFFGDSLTDSGFNNEYPGLPVGKAPTFTTLGGYTWAQYIAHDYKGYALPTFPPGVPDTITNNITPLNGPGPVLPILYGIDYAAAGSTTNSTGLSETWAPSLTQQIAYFLSPPVPAFNPNDIFFIWSGANDILSVLLGPAPTQLNFLLAAQTAAVNIANQVALLSSRGAKRFVIISLPNIGTTPLVNALAVVTGTPSLPASMQQVSFTFDSLLNQQLGNVISQYGIKVLYIDSYTLLDNVIKATKAGQPYVVAGQAFKFTNYTDPVCGPTYIFTNSAITCDTTSNGFVFADGIHPTDMAHKLLSLQVETEIQNWN